MKQTTSPPVNIMFAISKFICSFLSAKNIQVVIENKMLLNLLNVKGKKPLTRSDGIPGNILVLVHLTTTFFNISIEDKYGLH
jgi:hypothetical protein